MRRTFALVIPSMLLGAFALSGCVVQSLQPLYRDSDLVFQPELVGRWVEQRGSDRWEFARSGELAYKIVLTESDGDSGTFEGHVVKLGQTLFLDLAPDDHSDSRMAMTYSFHLVPAHTFARIDSLSPTLTFTPLDYDWLKKQLDQTPNALRHEVIGAASDQHVVLSASTAQLQAFITTHAKNAEAFTKPIVLEPIKEPVR